MNKSGSVSVSDQSGWAYENQQYIWDLYQSISQNIDAVIFIVGKQDKKIEYVFENADRVLGIPAETFYADDDGEPNELYQKIRKMIREKQPTKREVWEMEGVNQAFSQNMWLNVISCPIKLGGKEKYIFVLSDVTEEHLIRRALSEAAKAAELASAAKSRFLSNMSHDIRTPMNAIIGFATLAEKNLGDNEKVRDYLHKILSSGNILLDLINDVLDMSRIESGKMQIQESRANLFGIFDDLKIVIAEQVNAKSLKFTVDVSQADNPFVYCDEIHLKQMLMNLLSNAIKFTPEGGEVMLSLVQEPCEAEGYGNYVFHVKDTGLGMSQEFVQKVFDAFEREVNSTVNKIQGTGLGMAITKSIVELMNGFIQVETKQGEGTEFTVSLTFRLWEQELYQAKTPEEEENDGEIDFTGRRILLVEDNELNREIASEILLDYGLEVESAENGQAALEKLKSGGAGRYDLVLMDVQMPVMNGYEATKAIRQLEDPGLAGITIVAMTANAFHEDRQAALESGMDGFISKPIDVEQLVKTLKGIL